MLHADASAEVLSTKDPGEAQYLSPTQAESSDNGHARSALAWEILAGMAPTLLVSVWQVYTDCARAGTLGLFARQEAERPRPHSLCLATIKSGERRRISEPTEAEDSCKSVESTRVRCGRLSETRLLSRDKPKFRSRGSCNSRMMRSSTRARITCLSVYRLDPGRKGRGTSEGASGGVAGLPRPCSRLGRESSLYQEDQRPWPRNSAWSADDERLGQHPCTTAQAIWISVAISQAPRHRRGAEVVMKAARMAAAAAQFSRRLAREKCGGGGCDNPSIPPGEVDLFPLAKKTHRMHTLPPPPPPFTGDDGFKGAAGAAAAAAMTTTRCLDVMASHAGGGSDPDPSKERRGTMAEIAWEGGQSKTSSAIGQGALGAPTGKIVWETDLELHGHGQQRGSKSDLHSMHACSNSISTKAESYLRSTPSTPRPRLHAQPAPSLFPSSPPTSSDTLISLASLASSSSSTSSPYSSSSSSFASNRGDQAYSDACYSADNSRRAENGSLPPVGYPSPPTSHTSWHFSETPRLPPRHDQLREAQGNHPFPSPCCLQHQILDFRFYPAIPQRQRHPCHLHKLHRLLALPRPPHSLSNRTGLPNCPAYKEGFLSHSSTLARSLSSSSPVCNTPSLDFSERCGDSSNLVLLAPYRTATGHTLRASPSCTASSLGMNDQDDSQDYHLVAPSCSSSQSRGSSPVTIRGSDHPRSSPTESGDPLQHSSEDIFLTPRAQSPFFPTSLSGLPGQQQHIPDQHQQHTTEGPPPPEPQTPPRATRSLAEPASPMQASTSSTVTILSTPSPARGSVKSPSKKLGGGRRSSTRIYSDALEEAVVTSNADSSPPVSIPVRLASVPMASPDVASATAPPLLEAAAWTDQLRKSLIAEGLPETAMTAEQDLRQELRTLVVPTRSSSALGDMTSEGQDPLLPSSPSAAAVGSEMSDMSAPHVSDISRTPSTSTAGSTGSMAKSHASTETAPSSVLSDEDSDGADAADATERSGSNSSSASKATVGALGDSTASIADEKYVQSKLRRYHALVELVETERSYTNDLAILVLVYLEALPTQPFFEDHPARIDTVVRNTPELLAVHSDIVAQLESILEREGIAVQDAGSDTDKALSKGVDNAIVAVGDIFATIDQQLLPYHDFCARHAEALSVIREAEKRHNGEDFAQFERMCSNVTKSRPGSLSSKNSSTTEVHRLSRVPSFTTMTPTGPGLRGQSSLSTITPITSVSPATSETSSVPPTPVLADFPTSRQGGRLNFQDLLIKPVQRLCLYPLVLHTLLKHTGPDDAGKAELEAALATVRRVADEVDEAGKRREHFLLAELVASRVEAKGQVTRSLLSSYGRVYLSGTLDVLYHHPAYATLVAPLRFRFLGLFLYQGWLLITKVMKSGAYEPRFWFPLYSAQLSSVEEEEGVLPHAFRLTVGEEHHFELAASSSRERALWVDALSTAIAAAPSVPEANPSSPSFGPSSFPSNLYNPGLGFDAPGSPGSGRVLEVASRPQVATTDGRSGGEDPLNNFLVRHISSPGSSDVIVRYASLAQRAVVDKGMVFSDSVLAARAITHKDGTFTPGGSLTRSGPQGFQASSPTTAPVLASWQAATSTPQSSLGAAVGAAMGLARAAKRSSTKSSTNVFEAAAQQYLAQEETRMAEESKTSTRDGARTPGEDGTSMQRSWTGDSAPSPMKLGHRRKRSSFGGRNGLRPMSTIFPDFELAVRTSESAAAPSMDGGLTLGSPLIATDSPLEDAALLPASPVSSEAPATQSGSVRKRPGSVYGSSLRDAFSRKSRSQSADLTAAAAAAAAAGSSQNTLPQSPMRSEFLAAPSVPVSPKTSPGRGDQQGQPSGQMTRSSSIRRAFTNVTSTSRRERTSSAGSEAVVAPAIGVTPASSPGKQDQVARVSTLPLDVAALGGLTPSKRRTSGNFGSTLGLAGPPFANFRRSFTGFRTGGSRDSSRRSSIVDTSSDASGSISSASGVPALLANFPDEFPDAPADGSATPSSIAGTQSSLPASATDSALSTLEQLQRSQTHANAPVERPTAMPRTRSTPLHKKTSLSSLRRRGSSRDPSATPTNSRDPITALASYQASGNVFSNGGTSSGSSSSASSSSGSGSSLARSLSKRLFASSSKLSGSYSMSKGATLPGPGGNSPGQPEVPPPLPEEEGEVPMADSTWSFRAANASQHGPRSAAADVSPNTTPMNE